jgi:hypothetical protein
MPLVRSGVESEVEPSFESLWGVGLPAKIESDRVGCMKSDATYFAG